MMTVQRAKSSRRLSICVVLVGAALPVLGIVESCDDRLFALTRFVDPCGTFLANCTPGQFAVQRAELGDFCVDPTCTVPGQCGGGQALGTITQLCP
jgi:hypothetical protein